VAVKDDLGLTLSGAEPAALASYQSALRQLQCFVGDPAGAVEAVIEAAPGFVMAHVLKGYLYGLSTEHSALPTLRACHERAAALPASTRERAHVAALGALAEGRWHEAGRILEELTVETPRDVLALQAGHQIDFFTGQAMRLRDRIGRAMPAWQEGMPGYHAVLGMHAFGLEESGDYPAAERAGRRAVGLEPRDGWAQHAVAHVMEMQGRQRDGIAWMRASPESWSTDSFLKIHNWWHLALFHYELGELDEALALFDGPIFGDRSALALNLVDASALLWRLHLAGADVGERWQAVAENWAPKASAGHYAFNDAHAMMAFVGAGREEAAAELLSAQEAAMAGPGDNAAFTRDVGRPVTLAVKAFGEGRYRDAARLIEPLRDVAHSFGGSHAQRDVITLTLIEAALRADERELAARLSAERQAARPESPLARLFACRAKAIPAKVTSGFASGIAQKQRDRAIPRFEGERK
jgi:tetratricopeptide (TPR) repeat protein